MDCPWNSLGQNTGMGSLPLLQQISLTQELNEGLLHCRQILYQLGYQGSSQIILSLRQLLHTMNVKKKEQPCIFFLTFRAINLDKSYKD